MAMRLMQWLARGDEFNKPDSLAEAAHLYLREGGLLDWARLSLRSGDPVEKLSQAYGRLFERVSRACEERDRAFAELVADWTAAAPNDPRVIPVEQILERFVARLATQTPVLVIVIDGMSVAVFRQLLSDIVEQEWMLIAPQDKGPLPGIATVPSVTEVSRTSLLCGKLRQGDAGVERAGFAEHPALVAASR